MDEKFDAIALIAERKILEAMEKGLFDNLPWAGRPLPEDDLANLPEDLRLAWRLLRGAGYTDKSPNEGPIGNVADLLDRSPEEAEAHRKLTLLKLKLGKINPSGHAVGRDGGHENVSGSHSQNGQPSKADILESEYLDKLTQKIR
jgi:hypothetical protein